MEKNEKGTSRLDVEFWWWLLDITGFVAVQGGDGWLVAALVVGGGHGQLADVLLMVVLEGYASMRKVGDSAH